MLIHCFALERPPVLRCSVSSASPVVQLAEPLRPGPALVGPAFVIFRSGHVGIDGQEVRRLGGGGEHLRGAHVGTAEHTDLPIRIGQSGRPLHRVVAVLRFVAEGVELAARVETAARVLEDDHVTVRGQRVAQVLAAAPVIGRALKQHREFALGARPVDIGYQRNAVAHGGPDAKLRPHRVSSFLRDSRRNQHQADKHGKDESRLFHASLRVAN